MSMTLDGGGEMAVESGNCDAVPPRIEGAIRRGAESASASLSKWLGRPARIAVSGVCLGDLAEAVEALGPSDSLIAACGMGLEGGVSGTVLLGFGGESALGMVDALLGQEAGTAREWGELERSAAQETANIVVCAFVNALAWSIEHRAPLVPGPPEFRLDFAGSLLQFALMDQASGSDRIVLIEARFEVEGIGNGWSLVLVPTAGGLEAMGMEPGGEPVGGGPAEGTPGRPS
jgi:chemotaxis protein CheC